MLSTNSIIDDFEVFDSDLSELNTTLEYDDDGNIVYSSQLDSIIISNVFIIFSVSLVAGILLGRIFFKR